MNNVLGIALASIVGHVIVRLVERKLNNADTYYASFYKRKGELDAQEEHDRRKRMFPAS